MVPYYIVKQAPRLFRKTSDFLHRESISEKKKASGGPF